MKFLINPIPYDLAVLLLGMYLEKQKALIEKAMFIAALFTIVKTWQQPKCPLTDDWFKNV